MNGGSRSLLAIFISASLTIIDNLDAFRCAFAPDEANAPLIVDPDIMLTLPVTAQSLEPVSWYCRYVSHFSASSSIRSFHRATVPMLQNLRLYWR